MGTYLHKKMRRAESYSQNAKAKTEDFPNFLCLISLNFDNLQEATQNSNDVLSRSTFLRKTLKLFLTIYARLVEVKISDSVVSSYFL